MMLSTWIFVVQSATALVASPLRRSVSTSSLLVRNAKESWSTEAGPSSTIVVGGGPSGLATAMMLAERNWKNIVVIDRRPAPAEDESMWLDFSRNYLIGLGGRGQNALKKLGAWDEVEECCTMVVGRVDWAPGSQEGVERNYTDRPYKTQVLARDRLAWALYQKVRSMKEIEFRWNAEVVSYAGNRVTLKDGETLTAPFVVAADGAARVVANSNLEVVRYEDDNRRVFKSVPLKLPSGWRGDVNYSARSKDGRLNFDALPASREKDYCGVLLLRDSDPVAREAADPEETRKLLDAELPQFSALVSDEDVAAVAARPPSTLPRFTYVDGLTIRDELVVVGDAAHTVKPYFGLGANSALEDVVALRDALDENEDGKSALAAYSKSRSPEAKALVQISRSLDRPGTIGLLTFIGPIILDGIFHKFFPKIFQTNTIAMLQQQTTFMAVRRRKRQDRVLQLAVLSAVFGGLFASLAKLVVLPVARAVATLPAPIFTVTTAATCLWLALFTFMKTKKDTTIVDPADLLAATSPQPSKASSNEAFLMQQRLKQPDYK